MGDVFYPVVLTYVDWPSGAVRVHTGVGDITFNSQTWSGLGKYGRIELPDESLSLANNSARLTIAGTLTSLLGELGANPRNKTVEVYFGCVTEPSGNTLVGTPFKIFSGYVDSVEFNLNKQESGDLNSEVSVMVGTGPPARAGANITHSAEDQIKKYPGDTAGRHVINAIKKSINPDVWPEP